MEFWSESSAKSCLELTVVSWSSDASCRSPVNAINADITASHNDILGSLSFRVYFTTTHLGGACLDGKLKIGAFDINTTVLAR
jgi:hypothetical protein